jgi:hypothetical protein
VYSQTKAKWLLVLGAAFRSMTRPDHSLRPEPLPKSITTASVAVAWQEKKSLNIQKTGAISHIITNVKPLDRDKFAIFQCLPFWRASTFVMVPAQLDGPAKPTHAAALYKLHSAPARATPA